MLETQLKQLLTGEVPGLAESLDLVAGFDAALDAGLARLSADQADALLALAEALASLDFGEQLGQAVNRLVSGSIGDDQLALLAGARTSLLGAGHDLLLETADHALGRTRDTWEPSTDGVDSGATPVDGCANLLSGVRAWLRELAVAGWQGVDHDLVASGDQVLRGVLAQPQLRPLAVLLDGFAAELRACCPVATLERVPLRRWADL